MVVADSTAVAVASTAVVVDPMVAGTAVAIGN